MTAKHTPGPWVAVGKWVEHPDDGVADICNCNPVSMGQGHWARSDEEACANARLIAAAPEMLEALKQLLKCHDAQSEQWAREAIAKAEGGE